MSENISISSQSNNSNSDSYKLDGVIGERIDNYNDFVLSKRKMWRIPENDLKMYIIKIQQYIGAYLK